MRTSNSFCVISIASEKERVKTRCLLEREYADVLHPDGMTRRGTLRWRNQGRPATISLPRRCRSSQIGACPWKGAFRTAEQVIVDWRSRGIPRVGPAHSSHRARFLPATVPQGGPAEFLNPCLPMPSYGSP